MVMGYTPTGRLCIGFGGRKRAGHPVGALQSAARSWRCHHSAQLWKSAGFHFGQCEGEQDVSAGGTGRVWGIDGTGQWRGKFGKSTHRSAANVQLLTKPYGVFAIPEDSQTEPRILVTPLASKLWLNTDRLQESGTSAMSAGNTEERNAFCGIRWEPAR